MKNKDEFKWELPQLQQHNVVGSGDIRIVNLPVRVLFEWSDKIVTDYDSETDTVLEYKSGYVMKVIPDQKFVHKGEPTIFMGNAMCELDSPVYNGMFDIPKLNPVLANEHTPIDVNFGGRYAPIIGSGATKIVAPTNEDYLSVARGLFCTGIDHAAYFILNGYTFSQKKGCLLKCVDNKSGQTFEGAEAEKILFIVKGNQLVSDADTIKDHFDYNKIFMDQVEEMAKSVETLGHA